jgi:hypothetical protein
LRDQTRSGVASFDRNRSSLGDIHLTGLMNVGRVKITPA